jgi:hypothetical protein
LLGTLSEHGTGMAVDIDDARNPQLTLEEWKYIEALVGKQISRSGRWDSEEAATGLWKDIKEVNDRFLQKIKDETKKILEFQVRKVYGDTQSTLRRLAVETEAGHPRKHNGRQNTA